MLGLSYGSILFIAGLLHQIVANNDKYLSDHCQFPNGAWGMCTKLHLCDLYQNEKMDNIKSSFQCQPEGNQMIVCCPKPNIMKHISKAELMCNVYSKLTYEQYYYSGDPPLCPTRRTARIVGGNKAVSKEFPHMAAIGFATTEARTWQCGGTLISDRFVLTSAHCTHHSEWGACKWVRLGDLNLHNNVDDANVQDFRVVERIRHPNYDPRYQYYDIALLKLDRTVKLNAYVRPACLSMKFEFSVGERTIATGWGLTNWFDDEGSDHLLKVSLPVRMFMECATQFQHDDIKLPGNINQYNQFCAGIDGKDTCNGDSGGPLLMVSKQNCMHDLAAVTTAGKFCGSSFGMYTKVSSYVNWIEKIVWTDILT